MNKVVETFTMITAVLCMIIVPPLAGVIAYGLWLPLTEPLPALLAGTWTGVVVAAIIRRGFE
ncbi:MAG: hypothetical protein E5V72_03435 [Mesorhizobium sp.]|uniref:hypothetical protein n=1 Tax=Mesorhizobium sp. TaxID=1871066 RepID=UPI000FE42344|nr:hypothetical protein [Mesorhizobium sp.]RWH49593.1 MAG: hypothetical protein EOQ80_06710 [Mesorhizobium sp.]RWI74801.1 MAG: hypothetical protein EOR19_20165 [Mesorhizobium sp.]RWJ10563.1 MAG: hypothetical protein EOR24_14865 [Mesorhizobium sp.]RWJ17835.1 MAG: hypothetical protein EOR25_10740 [Mesorhizobium sp.]RWJ33294.1 MAG: hypothetical protein EOR28_11960 [Mesorhizobium sp.]